MTSLVAGTGVEHHPGQTYDPKLKSSLIKKLLKKKEVNDLLNVAGTGLEPVTFGL